MSSIMAEVVGCEYLWHVIGQWIPRGVDDPTWYQWEPWTSTNLEASMARMTQHRVLRSCQCSLSPAKNGFADGWIPFFHQIYFQIQLFCSHIFSFLPAQVSSIFLSVFFADKKYHVSTNFHQPFSKMCSWNSQQSQRTKRQHTTTNKQTTRKTPTKPKCWRYVMSNPQKTSQFPSVCSWVPSSPSICLLLGINVKNNFRFIPIFYYLLGILGYNISGIIWKSFIDHSY